MELAMSLSLLRSTVVLAQSNCFACQCCVNGKPEAGRLPYSQATCGYRNGSWYTFVLKGVVFSLLSSPHHPNNPNVREMEDFTSPKVWAHSYNSMEC